MRIICPKCGTEYFLEGEQLERDGTPVQCSACEHTFTVYAPVSESPRTPRSNPTASHPGAQTPAPAEPAARTPAALPRTSPVVPPPPPVRKGSGTLFLAQGDRVYKVKDIATLQRWVVEKRVLPGDRVSNDGKNWEVVNERGDLRAFFAIIDQLKQAKRALKQKTREMTAVSHEAEVARHAAIEAAAQIPGPTPEESTVRPMMDVSASGDMPDITGASADFSGGADPDDSLRAASLSLPDTTPVAPESVPDLPAMSAPSEAAVEDKFFSASTGSLPAAPPPPEESKVSFFDVRGTPIPDEESPSFNRMHEMGASGSVSSRDESVHVDTTPGVEDPGMSVQPSRRDIPQPAKEELADLKATRHVPVSTKEETVSAPMPSEPSPADESGDFDPNQTFDDIEPYTGGSGRGFYLGLLLLIVIVGGAMWYFLMGPGASQVFETGELADGAVEAEVLEETTPEEPASPEETPDAVEETPTPEPETPAPTPAPTVEPATPKPTRPPPSAREPATPKPTPKAKEDHMGVGNKARDRGNFRTAADAYGKALEADPRNFRAAIQLGWMNVELGRNSAAQTAFKKALALKGSSAEARYGLGLAYQASGKKAAAISEYERALALEPDGRDAREIRAILSQLQ